MSAPGRQGDVYRARSARVVDRCESGPEREAKPPVPVPPGVCPRCGEEKSWLRPGETCAPCLLPRGLPAPLVFEGEDGDEDEEESEMAKKKPARRKATCEECEEEFDASPFGRLPKRCDACKTRLAAESKASDGEEDEAGEEGQEGGTSAPEDPKPLQFSDTRLLVLAELAAERGVDPVEAILVALADSMYGEKAEA